MGLPRVEMWTDGSGQLGPGGWAYILRCNGVERVGSGHHDDTTNNRMEMTAVLMGLRALTRPCRTLIHTDSAYVMHGFTNGWVANWKRSGWLAGKKRDPVKNRDLWEALDDALAPHDVTWLHVPGHAGIEMNERADELAGEARLNGIHEPIVTELDEQLDLRLAAADA